MIKLKSVRVPLHEAVIEARFAGDARIDSWRGDFQQLIRGKYPLLFVPAVNPGDFPALMHYQFTNETQTARVSLSLNSLAYSSFEYPGWEQFKQEFLVHLQLLQKSLNPHRLTRLGVRFINHFDQDLARHLKQGFPKHYLAPLRLNPEFHISTTRFNLDDHKMLINVRKENGLLTLDYDAHSESILIKDASQRIEALHTGVETELFDVLRPSYVEQLSQNKIS